MPTSAATGSNPSDVADDQTAVMRFLSTPSAYPSRPATVERVETHGAIVFLAGNDAYKIKRAVRFAYLDYSTLDRRRAMVEREIAVNRPYAPMLYRGAIPITRTPDGTLALNGDGTVVEWCVHMRRFAEQDVLSKRVAAKRFSLSHARQLADTIAALHARLEPSLTVDSIAQLRSTIASLAKGLSENGSIFASDMIDHFRRQADAELDRAATVLATRALSGHVRRCHGDLHLNNIVMLDGVPTPFDAIEFDDAIATIDTLYDLAFLLMDLDHNGCRTHANAILNRYLWRTGVSDDVAGLIAMPLFLALRSAVRALVTSQSAAEAAPARQTERRAAARAHLVTSVRCLAGAPPHLIAIGGLSGTGKSTLAAHLAPDIGTAPGALHLRSDLERKTLFGVDEATRLPPENYTRASSERVYARLLQRARIALRARHAVIVDAVFADPVERTAIEAVAREIGTGFTGLWLAAPQSILSARVAARIGDASDATPDVVAAQVTRGVGAMAWLTIDASATPEETAARAKTVVQARLPR